MTALLLSLALLAGDATGPTVVYGEMAVTTAATISMDTADIPHVVTSFVGTHLDYVTFTANAAGVITAYSDGTGKVNVADGAHGLATGDVINITDTTNYNGVWAITKIDVDNFSIADTWVADDGASTWEQADRFVAQFAGDYQFVGAISTTKEVGASALVFTQVYINETAEAHCKLPRQIPGTDTGAWPLSCILDGVAVGDEIFVIVQSSNTNDITPTEVTNLQIHLLH